MFLEIWKRQRARVVLHWDLYGWDEDQVRRRGDPGACLPRGASVPASEVCPCPPQEEMALEFINCPDYELQPHQHSYLRSLVILVLSLFMVLPESPEWGWRPGPGTAVLRSPVLAGPPQICLMIGMAHLLVVYRVLAAALFNSALLFQEEQVTTAVVVTGALVHYVVILIMTKVAGWGWKGCGGGPPLRPKVSPLLSGRPADQQVCGPQAL